MNCAVIIKMLKEPKCKQNKMRNVENFEKKLRRQSYRRVSKKRVSEKAQKVSVSKQEKYKKISHSNNQISRFSENMKTLTIHMIEFPVRSKPKMYASEIMLIRNKNIKLNFDEASNRLTSC